MMGRAAFPGQKKMLADVCPCPLQFSEIAEENIQATLYLWPYWFYVFKRLSIALITSTINWQPLDNQSANIKFRFKISWEIGGFGGQWLPVVVRDRRCFLVGRGRRPVFTSL